MAVNIQGGTNNGIIGCDIYDVGSHINLSGGDTETLTGAGNYAVNNHFTQVQATDFYGRIAVRGVGNIFRNNLVHNAIGQIMTVGGNDHQIELNEMFNIGIEEGDGGTIYSGASMWTFGNVYRHNFLHHLMCLPQAHPRGGIYPDDHDAGDTIEENIFYKAAHRAILMNNGAGHTVQRNVFVNGYIGVYNTDAYAQKAFENIAKFESGELKRGDKGDHIWRTEQVIGKEGWNKAPWCIRYPTFQKVMNQERMRFSPIECRFIDNMFCGNTHNFLFRSGGWGPDNIKPVEEVEFIEVRGNRDIKEKVFTNLNELDLSFNDPDLRPLIPFEQIGIYQDKFRKAVPDKSAYRSAIKKHFENRPSYDPKAVYDPKTVNASIYFNTGKLILGTEH